MSYWKEWRRRNALFNVKYAGQIVLVFAIFLGVIWSLNWIAEQYREEHVVQVTPTATTGPGSP